MCFRRSGMRRPNQHATPRKAIRRKDPQIRAAQSVVHGLDLHREHGRFRLVSRRLDRERRGQQRIDPFGAADQYVLESNHRAPLEQRFLERGLALLRPDTAPASSTCAGVAMPARERAKACSRKGNRSNSEHAKIRYILNLALGRPRISSARIERCVPPILRTRHTKRNTIGNTATTIAAQIAYTGRKPVCQRSSARNVPRPSRNHR